MKTPLLSSLPADAQQELQSAFRLIWTELDRLNGRYVDMSGQRVIGRAATDKNGFTTLGQVEELLRRFASLNNLEL